VDRWPRLRTDETGGPGISALHLRSGRETGDRSVGALQNRSEQVGDRIPIFGADTVEINAGNNVGGVTPLAETLVSAHHEDDELTQGQLV